LGADDVVESDNEDTAVADFLCTESLTDTAVCGLTVELYF